MPNHRSFEKENMHGTAFDLAVCLGPRVWVTALAEGCLSLPRSLMPSGFSAGPRRLAGVSWWQEAPEGADVSRLGPWNDACQAGWLKGSGRLGGGGEIFKNKLWESVQNPGSMASFKSGFAEEFALESGVGMGAEGVEGMELIRKAKQMLDKFSKTCKMHVCV